MVDKSRLKEVVDKLYRYNYWFCNEMTKEEESLKEFEKACKEAERTKGCMEDTVKVINFLRNKEEQQYIEPWQLAGAEAILNQCKEDGVIPYDLPGALMAVFGMWNELEKGFKGE